jgi:hypothetical protein
MGTKELIAELEKARERFDWSLLPGEGPVADRRKNPRLRVRGRLRKNSDNVLFDPIGAVCFFRTGIMFSDHYWVEAAITIGLSIEDARDVIAAANDMTWRTLNNVRQPDPYKQALRECLLDITRPQAGITTASR